MALRKIRRFRADAGGAAENYCFSSYLPVPSIDFRYFYI
jgi:hypothetical protein